ncbi:MAG: hypothetical protein LEGION0403_FIIPPAGN_02118 [Legionella sp.]
MGVDALNALGYPVGRNKAYVSDITYVWTQEGWLYLAVVLDLYSRKIVGWSLSSRMKASLVCDALEMAIWQFGSLKQEPVQWKHYQTRYEAQQDILNYIAMFYNSRRLHSSLNYLAPNQYELQRSQLKKVA